MNEPKTDGGELAGDVSDAMRAALESVERAEGTGSAKAALPPAGIAELEKELKEVRAQLDLSVERARETLDRLKESHERHLRAMADLENYKKRAGREKDEVERFGIQRLLKDLLPVMDNLDRALEHAGHLQGPMAEGVSATRKIFEETLGRHGVKGFSAVGETFDPTRHEAMQQVETAKAPPGTVVSEMVRGYLLHDRLVRPALVAVAVAPAASSGASELPPAAEASPEASSAPDSKAASGTAGEGS